MHKQMVAKHDLMFHSLSVMVGLMVLYEVPEQRPHNWTAKTMVLLKEGVPQRQHLVPGLDGRFDPSHGGFIIGVRLTSRCLKVRMVSEERVCKHCKLIPSSDQLGIWMLEEATNISANQGLARDGEGTDHGNGYPQLLPRCCVVACPYGAVLVRTDEERAGEHKGAITRSSFLQALEGGPMHVVAVHVVQISVFHISVWMDCITRHRDLWAVEDRRLIHVVPDVSIGIGALVLAQCKLAAPVFAHLWIREIWVARCTRPAPPFIVAQR
mmetsp:Transcript_118101/g.220809  ORF Transcript_118101/g.220809 Transcript_118101/m.220809 type:complete len:268 (-) Transcript_118101:1761-2564(-)